MVENEIGGSGSNTSASATTSFKGRGRKNASGNRNDIGWKYELNVLDYSKTKKEERNGMNKEFWK